MYDLSPFLLEHNINKVSDLKINLVALEISDGPYKEKFACPKQTNKILPLLSKERFYGKVFIHYVVIVGKGSYSDSGSCLTCLIILPPTTPRYHHFLVNCEI